MVFGNRYLYRQSAQSLSKIHSDYLSNRLVAHYSAIGDAISCDAPVAQ